MSNERKISQAELEAYMEKIAKEKRLKNTDGQSGPVARFLKTVPALSLLIVCVTLVVVFYLIPPEGRTALVERATNSVSDREKLKQEMMDYHNKSNLEMMDEFKGELKDLRIQLIQAILHKRETGSIVPMMLEDPDKENKIGPDRPLETARRKVPVFYPEN